jgi:hypothetical protein
MTPPPPQEGNDECVVVAQATVVKGFQFFTQSPKAEKLPTMIFRHPLLAIPMTKE